MKSLFPHGSYLVAVAVCIHGGISSAFAAAKPNVVLIVTDDSAYSDFGFSPALNNRTTQNETPNLDALAQRSIVGSAYYTTILLCSPSRADMLTG